VGAVLVLFIFVVMLLNLGQKSNDLRGPSAIAAALVIAGLLAIELTTLWRYTPRRLAAEVTRVAGVPDVAAAFPAGAAMQRAAAQNVVQSVAEPMFRTYLIPFEITSVLLLAALVGAVVLAKRRI
jgi:NADH-quinone oxidoreductase subunit J